MNLLKEPIHFLKHLSITILKSKSQIIRLFKPPNLLHHFHIQFLNLNNHIRVLKIFGFHPHLRLYFEYNYKNII
jgi:hypothetical protein